MATTRDLMREKTHLRVLSAAKNLFQDHGFESTTIRNIARQADVSVGTVISVGDKNSLLVKVFDRSIEHRHSRYRSQTPTGVDGVVAVFEPFIELFTTQPELSRRYAAILVSGNHASRVFTELGIVLKNEIQRCLATSPQVADVIYYVYIGTLFTWPTEMRDDSAAAMLQKLRELVSTIDSTTGAPV